MGKRREDGRSYVEHADVPTLLVMRVLDCRLAYRSLRRQLLLLPLLLLALVPGGRLACAATTAGTVISETASATYQDASANNYSANSSAVTTTVANLPSLTVTAPSNQNVTPKKIVVDTFTLTNTGNNSGAFALSGDATFAGTATAPTLLGYILAGAASGTCSLATPCTYTTLNAQGGMAGIAAAGTATVGVEYQVASASTSGQTIQATLSANVAYASGTGYNAATSSNVTATPTDTLQTDARLDVKTTATTPGSAGANITWTVTANNGGANAAQDLSAVKTMLGSAAKGVAIFVPTPSYGGTYLTLQAQPSTPTLSGASSGATAALYYNATACSSSPTTGWSTTYGASSRCMAILLSGGASGLELPSATGGSSGAGSVTTAQITFSFSTNQPSGSGSANTNAVTLIASGAIGGVTWATGGVPILGQGVTMGTADAATASLISGIESNGTASSGTTAPGGASNSAGSNAYASYQVFIGQNNNSLAQGSWNGVAPGYIGGSNDSLRDFTFVGFDSTANAVNSASNSAGAPSGNTVATGGTSVSFHNAVRNNGNIDDSYVLSNNTVSGWTVAYYQNNCTTALASNTLAVPSGTVVKSCIVFTPPANVTAFNAYDFTITATSVGSGSVNDTTHDVLYAGGSVVVFKTYAVSGCPGGVTPANNGAISGCTVTYTITAVNEAPSANGGASSTLTASSIVITENGATGGNTWATNSNGLTAAGITLTSCASCTLTGNTTASTSFTVTIPSLAPQASGIFTYAVVVK